MKDTVINWCDSTFNCWEGCTKISPGCDHCYAQVRNGRFHDGENWGPGAPRLIRSDEYWSEPLKWDDNAARTGTRPRVFCASLADWADSEAPAEQRARLWDVIRRTRHLDWLLLTKRAGNIRRMLPNDWGTGYSNVWLGVTVENRRHGLPRLNVLRSIPAAIRFASIEPLLEDLGTVDFTGINWAIIGGETGSGARSMDTAWVEAIIKQCKEQNFAPWVKQLGKLPSVSGAELVVLDDYGKQSGNAEDWTLWPEHLAHLKMRELPSVDRDEIDKGLHEAELGRIASELGFLAAELEPEEAAVELKLRGEYISAERRLFLTRLERGRILAGYKALYGPMRKWSEFLRVIGIARRTAYDLLDAVEESEAPACAETAQSRRKKPGPAVGYDFDTAVDKAEASLNRIFKGLTEIQRQQALDALVDRLGARTGIRLAA
jgi:protein gp37